MEQQPKMGGHLGRDMAAERQRIDEREKWAEDGLNREEALQDEEGLFRSIVDYHMLDGMVICDWEGKILYANRAAARIVGLRSPDEGKGMNVADFVQPASLQGLLEDLALVKNDKGGIPKEYRLKTREGEDVWVEAVGTRIDYRGSTADLVTLRNVTERKKAAEDLRESENKYRSLVENANEGIFIVQDGFIKFPNPRTLQGLGYTAKELSEIPFAGLIHPEDRDAAIQRHLRRLKGEHLPNPYAYRVMNKAGEEIWIQLNSVPLIWEGRPATLNLVTDITHEKKLEKQFQAAQKMEALGTLAGGIAHNFNNLLMGIQGYVSLILFNLKLGDPFYEELKAVEEQVKNGTNLTGQLLGFARKGKYEVKPVDLNKIVQQSSAMFARTQKGIHILQKLQEDLWTAEVDKGQIEQALMNLYINAWQAMSGGGNLYLATENISLDESYQKPFYVKPGRYVKISITDTGIGMDKETQQKIFEPFFTTKELGRGTGLGLASVYGIVKNHAGHITVYSEPGQGATFNLYLPASAKKAPPENKSKAEILRGSETILLVDDEETIVTVVGKALQKIGYKVLVAKGGEEAIEIYRKNQSRIALVVLDLIMTGMGGGKVYDRLKKINPGVKVILSSGYSLDGEASEIMARGCNAFIQKPFGILDLSQKIREILDKPSAGSPSQAK